MTIFMQVGSIAGSASETKHSGWIPIKSCEFPVDRPGVNTKPGKVTDRLRSGVTFAAITVSKDCDLASPALMDWMVNGHAFAVLIAFCKENGEEITRLSLEDTLCTKLTTTCSGEEQPSETLSLDFTKILMEYTSYNEKNKAVLPTKKISYDLVKAISGDKN